MPRFLALSLAGCAAGARWELFELGEWALAFSPRVAVDPPDGLLLELGGSERLFGGEPRAAAAVVSALRERGIGARAAVAGTIGCAWALARFAAEPTPCVASGAEQEALAPLSIESLRLTAETADALHELGIETVGELYELERDALPARFGPDLLLRLDQALGRAFEPWVPLRPPRKLAAARELEAPVGLETVLAVLRELLGELVQALAERGESARELAVELRCASAPPVRESLVLARPSRDAAHLWALLQPRLERVQLGFGAETIALSVPESAPTPARQTARWSTRDSEARERGAAAGFGRALGELVDTLAARLGREHVRRVEAVESHLPERAFRARSALDPEPREERASARVTPRERPSRLFAPPEKVVVLERGEPALPARVAWRGESRRVVRCLGPERVEAAWWTEGVVERSGRARDYFRVEDEEGRWLWLARTADGSWFVHGEWS